MKKLASLILLLFPLTSYAYGTGSLLSPISQGFLGLVLIFIIIMLAIEAVKKPKHAIIIVVFLTLSMLAGFGIPLLVIKYTDNDFLHILGAIAGLIACMKIIGLSDKFHDNKKDSGEA